jgi:glycosyltransferase involved in cell wall biosynthesis
MIRCNVLYVENFSEIIGGGQISLLGLLEKLDREKFNPIVICPAEGNLVAALERFVSKVKIVKMQSLKKLNLYRIYKSISEIRRLIRDEKIDLIHCNGSRACFYAGIAGRLERVPVIWHVRIADRDILLDTFLASLSTKIVAISNAVNMRFTRMGKIKEKVRTIYNGVDLERFNPSISGENIRKEFGLDAQAPFVGMVGRLDWYKGHKYFLKAARKVVDIIPECRFLIVGEGEKRKELESLATRLKLNNNVIFTGKREDIPEILASLNLFVLSSVSEGLGRSIIEAMAMERAVVATNVGGIAEVVKDKETGILVPVRDEVALAEGILKLLRDKDMALKMGLAGRRIVESKFDIKINAEKLQDLYEEILKIKN